MTTAEAAARLAAMDQVLILTHVRPDGDTRPRGRALRPPSFPHPTKGEPSMSSNRIGRINDEIQKELSALLRTVKDPRVTDRMLTITHVDTTSDLRYARIYVSALNCPDEKGLLKGLKSAAGYLRHELGSRIDLRYTPELQFFVDDSIAYGAHILDMLNHVKPADPRNADIVLPEDRED